METFIICVLGITAMAAPLLVHIDRRMKNPNWLPGDRHWTDRMPPSGPRPGLTDWLKARL
jgi:hypothetical protein